jgi:hypothetical protein
MPSSSLGSATLVAANVDFDGTVCDYFTGSTCLVPTFFETALCGPFNYYQDVNTGFPKAYDVFSCCVRRRRA